MLPSGFPVKCHLSTVLTILLIITGLIIPLGSSLLLKPRVVLESGPVEGFTEIVNNRFVDVFLGMRYAEPPIGDLRFRPTVPLQTKSNVTQQATEYGPNCWEPIVGPLDDLRRSDRLMVRSEDCLFINVWSPRDYDDNGLVDRTKLKPVFTYIHGGVLVMFSAGDSKWMDGKTFSEMGDFVVVSFNYRLGALGFMYGDRDDVPGNQGLYDQIAALKWIHENIHHFGGDPSRVTLDGISSGSLCSSMIFISGHVNGYVNGLVVDSGQPSPAWLDKKETSLKRFRVIASKVGCLGDQAHEITDQVIECLRNVPAPRFVVAQFSPENLEATGPDRREPFFPTLGSNLFPETSLTELYEARKWASGVPVLISLVTDEGYAPSFYGKFPKPLGWSYSSCVTHIKATGKTMLPEGHDSDFEDIVKNYCQGNEQASVPVLMENFNHMLGDWYITCPTLYFADILASEARNPVYSQKFTYYNATFFKKYFTIDMNGGVFGPRHGVNKIYVFAQPFNRPKDFNDNDRLMSAEMVKIMSNFVKTGTPNWTPYQVTSAGRIIPYQREINVLKDIHSAEICSDRVKCLVWDDLFFGKSD